MNQRTLTCLAAVLVSLASAAGRANAQAPTPSDAPPAAAAAPSAPAAAPIAPAEKVAPPIPMPGAVNKFAVNVYGFVELDTWLDNVLNAGEGIGNSIIAKPGTQAGTNGRWVWSPRNSRFGFRVAAPAWEGTKASANIETDFGGGPAGTAAAALGGGPPPTPYGNVYGNEAAYTTTGVVRIRHAWAKLETPYVDILIGQTWDVFGNGVVPFVAGGPEFQGIPGQLFHRNPQLRLSHLFKSESVNVELIGAAVRPFQRDAIIPDLQGGLKVSLPGVKGVHVAGAGKPIYSPLTVAVSGMYRSFKLIDHPALGPTDMAPAVLGYVKKFGWGVTGDVFLPVHGANMEDQSNAIAITGEVGLTSGGADMFGALGGGLPGIPPLRAADAMTMVTLVPYPQNFDAGIITWNGSTFVPIKWLTWTAGLQYHIPVYDGKLFWLTGNAGSATLQDVAKYGIAATPAAQG
ncbi:MAG TPA: hypothetical protein VFH73_02565, partial [Polyangia bacterium]|nr:hypothetical protein [Polyangia bacterium]